jgi:hypothetical protein
MSSSKVGQAFSQQRALARLCLLFAAPAILSAQSFSCPATVSVTETASTATPWQAEAAKSTHKFLRPSIYNGTPGKNEAELAPDDTQTQGRQVTQTWKLTDYRGENLFLRCRYEGSSATVVTNLPARLKTCTFSFRNIPGNQPVASPVFSCQ